jgi:hypothetical protein
VGFLFLCPVLCYIKIIVKYKGRNMKPFLFLFILLLAAFAVLAQDSAYSACEDLSERLAAVQESAAALDASSPSLSEDIAAIQSELAALDAECRGLSFSSEVDGSQPVIGPIILEEGVYRVTFTTDGYGSISGTVLEGDCEREIRLIFNESEGDASDGSQAVLDIEGDCEVLLELDNITDDWTLTIESLR